MDHAAEIIELRKTVERLEKEINRLDERKFPVRGWLGYVQGAALGIAFFGTFGVAANYFAPDFGLRPPFHGSFGSVEAHTVRIEDYDEPENRGYIAIDATGPKISLRALKDKSVDVDSRKLRLEDGVDSVGLDSRVLRMESERGTLILELNEKGEPVIRSIPRQK